MRICIVGPGHIGANLAKRFADAGNHVTATFATDAKATTTRLSKSNVRFEADGTLAAREADVVVISVPWEAIDRAWSSLGPLDKKTVVVDTTNPFSNAGRVTLPSTPAEFNAKRFGASSYTKAFNTLTSAFQESAIERAPAQRAAMFYVATGEDAQNVANALIEAVGFVPVYVGTPAESAIMEAPRRPGSVYGEEYTPHGAFAAIEAYRSKKPS